MLPTALADKIHAAAPDITLEEIVAHLAKEHGEPFAVSSAWRTWRWNSLPSCANRYKEKSCVDGPRCKRGQVSYDSQ